MNLASIAGATPLYAVINTEWAPRTRFPQPQATQFQKTTHLELMKALRETEASRYTERDTPIFVGSLASVRELLDSLDGARTRVET